MPLNGTRRYGNNNKQCRRCQHTNETLPHVLCHCTTKLTAITRRHNAILDRLERAYRAPAGTEVRKNQTVPGTDSPLRPDLVITNDVERTCHIIDVATPFENRYEAFQQARAEKLNKYAGIASTMREKGYEVTVDAFIVGALGGWDPVNENVIRKLGLGHKYSSLMKKLMVTDAIR